MLQTRTIDAYGEQYSLHYNFNPDNNTNNIDVKDDQGKFLFEIPNTEIPDEDATPEEIESFETTVLVWIEETLF